jgi:hypothetical protein
LVHLEDVIEEQELFTAQVIDTKKLSEYNQRKQDELENCKGNIQVVLVSEEVAIFLLLCHNITSATMLGERQTGILTNRGRYIHVVSVQGD